MSKKTLVIGASLKRNRYSNLVIHKLVDKGISVVTHGSNEGEIAGIIIDTELILYDDIDTVTLYLNPIRQKTMYNYIVSLKPNRVIFNPGAENPEFYSILKENDIHFEVACTLTLLATNQY